MPHTTQQTDPGKSTVFSPLAVAIRLSLVGLTLVHGTSQAATVTVTSSGDIAASGCTLREAMEALNSQSPQLGCNIAGNFGVDDSITFSSVLNGNNSIRLLQGRLDLGPDERDVLIDASNITGGITINANADSRVFFTNGVELELNNITITGGSSAFIGGGVFAYASTISLIDSSISGNSSDTKGGGIYGFATKIELTNSTVTGNGTIDGGGIYVRDSSNVYVNNSDISDNTAIRGGGIEARYSSNIILSDSVVSSNNGGGLRVFDSSYIDLSNSTVSDNSSGYFGGGGLAIIKTSSAHVTNSRISGNSTSGYGGGIYSYISTFSLNNSTLSNNSAMGRGGGFYSFDSTVTLVKTTILNNSTPRSGGGIAAIGQSVSLNNSTISNNSAQTDGGGIYFRGSTVSLKNSTVSNNSTFRDGGGIISLYSTIDLNNSIIADSQNSGDCSEDSDSTFTIDPASIIEDGSCNATRSGDPGLLSLADNGGATKTHALKSDSIARDTGILASCTSNDQRDQLRDDGDGACDVGAIEFNANDDGTDQEGFYIIPLENGGAVAIPL